MFGVLNRYAKTWTGLLKDTKTEIIPVETRKIFYFSPNFFLSLELSDSHHVPGGRRFNKNYF